MTGKIKVFLPLVLLAGTAALIGWYLSQGSPASPDAKSRKNLPYKPRQPVDTSGFNTVLNRLRPFADPTDLNAIATTFEKIGKRQIAQIDADLAGTRPDGRQQLVAALTKVALHLYEGEAKIAYELLTQARALAESDDALATDWLYTLIYCQGVAGLRRGEDENCVHCLGDGACIFPIRPSAVHTNRAGSELAVKHFSEYLEQFPNDLGARWLLNIAHMTLGQHPGGVPEEHRIRVDNFGREFDIGRFHDIAHLVGVNRFNMAGGAVMDDFDNDGLLDLVTTSMDPTMHMAFYRNKGDGTFEDRTEKAGLTGQYGGLYIVQTDYNNDGHLDLFIPRGAWLHHPNGRVHYPIRPSLLRNNGNGTFTDVTKEAGLAEPLNSITATWADFDNDGFLDLFVCCEHGPNRLYRNKGDGSFEEVAAKAGVQGKQQHCKGAAWIDYDNDGYPDLFLQYLGSTPQLFHNNRNGTFTDVTEEMGITGPQGGFSCWAFDYDNDGWLDLFATCYQRTLVDLVNSLLGLPVSKGMGVTRLYRNQGGKKFQDVSKETGVDKVFATMGSNFADFDNDGYLDFYLATGDPSFATLVPNRMFKNVGGKRFAEITATAGTGHLQKGHAVACGDWDRNGSVDLFVQIGGAVPGDRFHNALFQNPGQGNNWLTVKLVGKKTNRAAIGARIKAVTAGKQPLTVHRHVSSGSSFGGNPLQQTLGLGKAARVATLEVYWPTSKTTQVFRDVPVNQAIEITEFAENYRRLNWKPLPVPKK
jgi:hypothetical protein